VSSYYNCGAFGPEARRVATKKQLKELLASVPDEVYFDGTAAFFQDVEGYRAPELPEGVVLSVVGPDPYTTRKWYATVQRKADNTIKVS